MSNVIKYMLEKDYKKEIRLDLETLGAKCIPLITGQLGFRGEPDIIGVLMGVPFVIEAKISPNKVTLIQKEKLEQWAKAGAITVVCEYPTMSAKAVALYIQVMAQRKQNGVLAASDRRTEVYEREIERAAEDGSGNRKDEDGTTVHSRKTT